VQQALQSLADMSRSATVRAAIMMTAIMRRLITVNTAIAGDAAPVSAIMNRPIMTTDIIIPSPIIHRRLIIRPITGRVTGIITTRSVIRTIATGTGIMIAAIMGTTAAVIATTGTGTADTKQLRGARLES
jgi:hypothetical protein